jgi:MFS family permease
MREREMDKSRLLSGITINIMILGIASMLTDVSSEMIFALLPFFIKYELHSDYTFLGLIEGMAETVTSFVRIWSGWLSDKIKKRKPLAVAGYAISAVLKPFFAVAVSPLHVLIVRVSDRFGKGVRTPPRDALIADSVEANVRGKAYGFHRSMDTIGAVLGPLFAFLLFPIIFYRGVFLASFIPAIAAVMLLLIFVKEKPPKQVDKVSTKFSLELKSLSPEFKKYLFIAAIFAFGNFSYAFFLLRAQSLGIEESYAVLLYMLFNVVYVLFAFPSGVLADKVGKKSMISFGYFMFGITCLGFAFAYSPIHGVLLFIAYGVFYAVVDTVQRAIVPDFVAPETRGAAFGALHTVIGIVALPSSLIAGALSELIDPTLPFKIGAITALFSSISLFLLTRQEKGKE